MILPTVIILIFAGFIFKKIFLEDIKASDPNENSEDIAFIEISNQIDYIAELKDNLQNIEDMITEIEICDPDERATAFNISMPTNNTSVSIMANNGSQAVLELLKDEREKLRTSLTSEIKKLRIIQTET